LTCDQAGGAVMTRAPNSAAASIQRFISLSLP
jgi:hypothetical protein